MGAEAGGQHDQPGRGDRGALVAEPRARCRPAGRPPAATETANVVSPTRLPTTQASSTPEHRAGHLPQAARERPVDGRVHDQQRRPRRQERLRQREHLRGQHPGDDGRHHGLDQLEDLGPPHRVAQVLADLGARVRSHRDHVDHSLSADRVPGATGAKQVWSRHGTGYRGDIAPPRQGDDMSEQTLQGRTIAFLVAAEGIEQVELTEPWKAVQEAGGTPRLLSPEPATCRPSTTSTRRTRSTSTRRSPRPTWRRTTRWCCPAGWRTRTRCAPTRRPSRSCGTSCASGKPVAAICHAPWTLIEAGRPGRPHAHLLAEPADRHPQRRRHLGRRGGRRRRQPRHQPQPRRPPGVHRRLVELVAAGRSRCLLRRWGRRRLAPGPARAAG